MNEIIGLINISTGVGITNADARYTFISTTSSISGNLQNQIDTIELTPGPQGVPGISGSQGIQGIQGARGGSTWTPNLLNVTQDSVDSTKFIKTGGLSDWGNAQIYSTQCYTRGAFCSATITTTNDNSMFGLNSDPTRDASYDSIDFAFYSALGTLYIFEEGVSQGTFGTYTTSTVLTITYDGVNVRYWVDGSNVRTVARAIGLPLYLDSSIYQLGAGFANLVFGPMGEKGVDVDSSLYTLLTTTSSISGSLINDINTRALDTNVVHITGNESISGIKTFANQIKSGERTLITPSGFGWNPGYRSHILGSTGTDWTSDAVTLSLGCDISTVTGGSFQGNGSEVALRRGMTLIQPNVTTTDWERASINVGEVNVSRSSVIGTDPGGSELLRVGGSARINGQLNIVNSDISMSNDHAIYAGGASTDNLRLYFNSDKTYYRAPSGGHVWQNSYATNIMSLNDVGNLNIVGSINASDAINTTGTINTTYNGGAGGAITHTYSNVHGSATSISLNADSGTYLNTYTMGTSGYGISNWINSSLIESVGTGTGKGSLALSSYYGDIHFQINARTPAGKIDYTDGKLKWNNGINCTELLIGADPGGGEKLKVTGGARFTASSYFLSELYVTSTLNLAGRSFAYSDSSYTYLYGGSSGYKFNNSDGSITWATLDASAFVLGTDPGGSSKLRIGGAMRISDNITLTGAKYVYLRGDYITDGSVRISSPSDGTAKLEAYTTDNGWQNISFT